MFSAPGDILSASTDISKKNQIEVHCRNVTEKVRVISGTNRHYDSFVACENFTMPNLVHMPAL